MKNIFKKVAVFGVTAAMVTGTAAALAGCANRPAEAGDRTVIYYQAANMNTNISVKYNEMVKAYNDTQGKTDNVYVQLIPSASAVGGLENSLISNYQYDVVQIPDDGFKSLVLTGQEFFVELDKYLTDDVKTAMHYDNIPAGLKNRFRMNQKPESNTKYNTGEGTATLGLPIINSPQVMYYNTVAMEKCTINVISVAESELAAYNTANGASLKPHGYAEYKEKPYEGAKTSRNEAGAIVYKVFNDRIPMNWEENRCLSRAFMGQGYEAGYISEWWYNYGWSIGGDCIGWDTATDAYVFTLADDQSNWLALDNVTVNGRSYAAGDVLIYEDKSKVNEDSSLKFSLEGKLYELPSQRDAILEFNRLAVPTTKNADTGMPGYGVSSESVENRTGKFTSGKVPFYIESYENTVSYKSSMRGGVDIAPVVQYREYDGGSTYQKNGAAGFANEFLKVIGEEYDGEVYTGELKTAGSNNVPVTGRCATESKANGLFIPKNAKNKNYDAAAKFVVWAASPEAQKILSSSGVSLPVQSDLGLGECSKDRALENSWAAAYSAQHCDIGDYTYFTSETWITEWSVTFNTEVRKGNMTLSAFLDYVPAGKNMNILALANATLKNQRMRMVGR